MIRQTRTSAPGHLVDNVKNKVALDVEWNAKDGVSRRPSVSVGGFSFDEFAVFEACAGADERDQVWCVDGSPVVLGGFDEFEMPSPNLRRGSRARG